jgi:hypothetical protein
MKTSRLTWLLLSLGGLLVLALGDANRDFQVETCPPRLPVSEQLTDSLGCCCGEFCLCTTCKCAACPCRADLKDHRWTPELNIPGFQLAKTNWKVLLIADGHNRGTGGYSPQSDPSGPEFISVPTFRQSEATTYGDVMSHTPANPDIRDTRSSSAHETCHDINNWVRNKWTQKMGKRVGGFYAFDGKAMVVEEPSIQLKILEKFVPTKLRGMRWKTYVNPGNPRQPGGPLYLFDEWSAYIAGAAVSVDDFQRGKGYLKSDGTRTDDCDMSVTEFAFYGIGMAMAVEWHDPEYFHGNPQFRLVTKALLEQSNRICQAAMGTELHWPNQDNYVFTFRTDPSCEAMRDFVKQYFEGAWLP